MSLMQEWSQVSEFDARDPDTIEFRQKLRRIVCLDYCWLVSELFELEGDLGWGPGHREFDEDYLPPRVLSSHAHMETFLNTLERVRKDTTIRDLISGAITDKRAAQISKCLTARKVVQSDVVQLMYSRVAMYRSAYTLGGARMYLSMWTDEGQYALSVSGLINLLHNPLSKLSVGAETVRRKLSMTNTENFNRPQIVGSYDSPKILQSIAM